jgi:hypothetical protein
MDGSEGDVPLYCRLVTHVQVRCSIVGKDVLACNDIAIVHPISASVEVYEIPSV